MAKAIIFDVGGVLVDYDRDSTLHDISARCRLGTSSDDIGSIIQSLRLSEGSSTVHDMFSAIVETHGFDGSIGKLLEIWSGRLTSRDWVPSLVSDLKARASIYILSDTNAAHWSRIDSELLPLELFDDVFLSHELGMTKAGREIFDHVIGAIGLAPDQCLFVDDTAANADIARSTGLRSHHFNGYPAMIEAIELHLKR